jgi:hypothetical protein
MLKMGVDAGDFQTGMMVKSGKVREAQLDESVRRGYKTRSGQ